MATYEPILDEVLVHTHPGEDITGGNVGGAVPVRSVSFATNASLPAGVGQLKWNSADGTLNVGLADGTIDLQIGQKQVVRVVNKTTNDLLRSNYSVVRARRTAEGGAQGQRVAVLLAQANNENNSNDIIGVVAENILKNEEGFVVISGQIANINTTGSLQSETWSDGDILYMSPTISGGLTNIQPQAPDQLVVMGYVEYAHATQGKILITIRNSWEIDELHNVRIASASLATNQVLAYLPYNASISLWQNTNAANLSLPVFMQLNAVDTSTVDFTYSAPTLTANVIPSGIPHNSLASLQGGTIDEFFHLSASLASVASRQANASLSGFLSYQDWYNFSNLISFPTLPLVVADTATVDFTLSLPTLSATVIATGIVHGSLASLGIDDHTQYALLAGRSGGQTLNGGTASGENLVLSSTANATKGKILFGNSAYDQANNRLGVGTSTPSHGLDVVDNLIGVTRSFAGVPNYLFFWNRNSTDGNGDRISFYSDSTGVGATESQDFGSWRVLFDTHDDATRTSSALFKNYVSGVENTWLWAGTNGNIGLANVSLTPQKTITLGSADNRSIGITDADAGTAGKTLTISGGTSGAGVSLTGGPLALEAGVGTGVAGSSVVIRTGQVAANATTAQVITERMRINNEGQVLIGSNSAPTSFPRLHVIASIIASTTGVRALQNNQLYAQPFTGSVTSDIRTYNLDAVAFGSYSAFSLAAVHANAYNDLEAGFQFTINQSAYVGTNRIIGDGGSINSQTFRAQGVWAASAGGSVTRYSNFHSTAWSIGANAAPKVGTAYGIYLEGLQATFATTAYGVFQAGANDDNYFAGAVGVGNASVPRFLTVHENTNSFGGIEILNRTSGTLAATTLELEANNSGQVVLGKIGSSGSSLTAYGSARDAFIYAGSTGGGNINIVNANASGTVEFFVGNSYGTTTVPEMSIFPDNRVAINSTLASVTLNVGGRIAMQTWTADGDTAAYRDTTLNTIALVTSDARLKKDISPVPNSLEKIDGLTAYYYHKLQDAPEDKFKVGVLAQEVMAVLPELTFSFANDDDPGVEYYSVHYDKLSALAIQGVKDLHAKVKTLEQRIAELEAKLGVE